MTMLLIILLTFSGIGRPAIGIGHKDTGYCESVGVHSGSGWNDSLSWPIDNHEVHDNRHFRIGHTGIDLDAEIETDVYPSESGRVVFSGWSTWGFGNLVVLSHGHGWHTFYAHLDSVSMGCGAWVDGQDVIGQTGRTGAATWPHLHFEVRNMDTSHDPTLFLQGE